MFSLLVAKRLIVVDDIAEELRNVAEMSAQRLRDPMDETTSYGYRGEQGVCGGSRAGSSWEGWSMALHGTLDSFGVAEVLALLAATAKTGCLRVEGDGGRGAVWLREGAVTSASSDRVPEGAPDEVVCDLMRYATGGFRFEFDGRAPQADAREEVDELLGRAGRLLAEWRELEAVVPSSDHRVGLVDQLPDGGTVTVTAAQWPILVAVAGGCTVGDLATTLGLSELSALRAVNGLVTSGLTTVRTAGPVPRGESVPTRRAPEPRAPLRSST